MALDFDGSDDSVVNDSFTLGGYPFSYFCRFFPDTASNHDCLMYVGNKDTDIDYFAMAIDNNTQRRVNLELRDTSSQNVYSTQQWTQSAWNTVYAGFLASNSQRIILNGGSPETGAVSIATTFANIDRLAAGRMMRLAPRGPFNGRLADVAVWSVDLSTNEVYALNAGMSPLLIRPSSLLAYWPMFGTSSNVPDWGPAKLHGTITGALRIDHPPKIDLWIPPRQVIVVAATAPETITMDKWYREAVGPKDTPNEVVSY